MKKRLRKKLRLKEFTEYGVALWAKLKPWASEDESFEFFLAFADFIDPMGLICVGIYGEKWDVYIAGKKRQSVTEQHKEKIKEWLTSHSWVIDCNLSELQDSWHGEEYFVYNEEQGKWESKPW